jgi:hypothetical protein
MHVLQRPAASYILFGCDEVDRLGHPRVRRNPRFAEVLEPTQNIIVITGWKRELSPGWINYFAG